MKRSLGFLVLSVLILNLHTISAASKPNVLVIMTDQQSSDCMSCLMGNEYLNTPNMDALVKKGMHFTRAYSPNPLCMPMRTAMMTGHYPHQTGVQTNTDDYNTPDRLPYLGNIFKEAGYETAYFGKWHIRYPAKEAGFDIDRATMKHSYDPAAAVNWIQQKHEKPFLAFASFNGPHEICEWSRRQKLPGEAQIGTAPEAQQRPPLRSNMAPPTNETDIMAYLRQSYQTKPTLFPVSNYTDNQWTRLLWGYYRLIERVDGFVGEVLHALHASGEEENTVVIFLSDHGDCMGAHLWNQKTVFYEESARVPFVIAWPGHIVPGSSDVLLNTGIDLMPTLCDLAGITPPSHLPGKSLKALAMGQATTWTRDYVVSQNHFTQNHAVEGVLIQPHGRMVRSEYYKYCLYSEGDKREELYDIQNDPGEKSNLATQPDKKAIVMQHRAMLAAHAQREGDTMAKQMLRALDDEIDNK